jgi:hypothetical protein
VQKARSSMPNNTGEFATRVAALRARLDGAQARLAAVARQQNALLEALARSELEQQKERIGTYQIQARFALAAIYDRAAAPPSTPKAAPQESQGELENVPTDEAPAPMDGAPPPPDASTPATDSPRETPPTDSAGPAVDTSQAPPETEAPK